MPPLPRQPPISDYDKKSPDAWHRGVIFAKIVLLNRANRPEQRLTRAIRHAVIVCHNKSRPG